MIAAVQSDQPPTTHVMSVATTGGSGLGRWQPRPVETERGR
jgi:hypothetical protein